MEVGNPSFLNLGSTRKIDVIDVIDIDGLCNKTDEMPSSREILLSRGVVSIGLACVFGRQSVGVCCRCRS
jgi:hypothetical protein